MPYRLSGNCVKKTSGETVKCHPTRAEAVAHLRALYKNVEDAKESRMLTPKEFTSKFKVQEKDFAYAREETWVVDSATSALSYLMSVARQEMYMQEASDTKEVIAMIKSLLAFMSDQMDEMNQAVANAEMEDMVMYKDANAQFLTTKESDGKYRWTMITGSAFEDKDGEIISTKAFERDCDEMELTGDYGELLWWHCDGTQHATDKEARPYIPLGVCDTSFVYEKLNIESGTYYDNQIGEHFESHSKEFGASKSFYHKEDEPTDEGVYTFIRTKERSLLPRTKEANLLTRLFGQKEKEMADNKQRIDALKEKLGEDKVTELLEQGKAMSKKAEEFLASKEKKEETKVEEKVEAVATKELTDAIATLKEATESNLVSLKEMKVSVDSVVAKFKELEEANKEILALKENMAQTQGAVATLMGFTPKGFSKFEASKEGKEAELTEEQKKLAAKVKEASVNKSDLDYLSAWIMTGEHA